jgi:hypothetical protein
MHIVSHPLLVLFPKRSANYNVQDFTILRILNDSYKSRALFFIAASVSMDTLIIIIIIIIIPFLLFFFFFFFFFFRARQPICPVCTSALGLLCNTEYSIQHTFSSPVSFRGRGPLLRLCLYILVRQTDSQRHNSADEPNHRSSR